MMSTTRLLRLAPAFAVAALLGACASTPVSAPVAPPAPTPVPAPAAPAPAPMAHPVAAPAAPETPAWLDPSNPVARQRSVFFDFDESLIREQDRPVVELQGRFLAAHPAVHVRVEGNTDERGGSEYNLALGQRRAEAVAKALELMGVKAGQVEAVSFGKERPRATGHDEASWAQNRRADVAYPSR